MKADTGGGHLWGTEPGMDDGLGAREWIRVHRIYCTAVVAIVVATLFGAHWAGQPSEEIGTMSTPSVIQEASLPAVN